MNQVLHAQLTFLFSIDGNPWQQNSDQIESHLEPVKRSRSRGVFLSHQGWQKLVQAGVLHNEFGEHFTYGQLSERSLLDERTISRLLSCEVNVDKNTLKTFFRTFDLLLEASDYITVKNNEANGIKSNLATCSTLTIQRVEFEQIVEELSQLKQQLREYDHLFRRLGLNETHTTQQLEA